MTNNPTNEMRNPFAPERESFDVVHRASSNMFDVYINQAIGAPEKYTKLITFLRQVTELDDVRCYINCPGGRMDAGLQLLNAFTECKAKLTMVLDGEAYSMAAYFMFAGDEIIVNDNSMLMIHNYSAGQAGKGGELLNSAEAYNAMSKKLMIKYFSGFLSDQEMIDVLHGRDMYFDTDEINERLEQYKTYCDAECQRFVNQLLESQEPPVKPAPAKKAAPKKKAPAKKAAPKKKAPTKR